MWRKYRCVQKHISGRWRLCKNPVVLGEGHFFSHLFSLYLGFAWLSKTVLLWCCFLERGKRDHRIMERFWRNLKNHLVPIPLPWKKPTSTRLGCSEPYSAWDWPTASVGNTFECLTILTEYSTLLQLKAIPPLSCHYTPVKKIPLQPSCMPL